MAFDENNITDRFEFVELIQQRQQMYYLDTRDCENIHPK